MKNQSVQQKANHLFTTESEVCPEFNWKTDSKSILSDIKALIQEYYFAAFTGDGQSLKLDFNNGQSFSISVTENQ